MNMAVTDEYIALEHSRFRRAQRLIFLCKVTPDCMSHICRLRNHDAEIKLDACCQYGVDADVAERDGILAHAGQIRSLLRGEAKTQPWFKTELVTDADFPSGAYVRTNTHNGGCIFLSHEQRGCAIHRAAIEGGWRFEGVKPHVCRLFPLSYEADAIVLSDDYADYSCSMDAAAPSVYRLVRDIVGEVFGDDVVTALDVAERAVIAFADDAAELHTLTLRSS